MNILEAVNKIITRMGENPVTNVDMKHPTVSVALQHLQSVNTELQLPGWWFNEGYITLKPDAFGNIVVPEGTVSWLTKDVNTHLEGRTVVNSDTLDKEWDRPLTGKIIRDIPFEEVPRVYAEWVAAEASIRAYMSDYGVDDMIQIWQADAFRLGQLVQKEHLNNRRYNVKNRRITRKLYRSIYR